MLETIKVYYFNNDPSIFGFKNIFHKTLFGHSVHEEENKVFIKPIKYSSNSLSPLNILSLKKTFNIKDIYMYDRVRGVEEDILITDHINRSGLFFLRGKTPHKHLTMFPDMSGVYIKKSKLKKSVVQTLGPKRFKTTENEEGVIFSEGCAITATLWHYVGVNIKCFGVSMTKETKVSLTE